MIEATESQAHHQHHRQIEPLHKIDLIQPIGQRRGPTADTFNYYRIGLRSKARIRSLQLRKIHMDAHRTGRELRRSRPFQRIRIDVFVSRLRIACGLQTQRIVVAPAIGRVFAAAGDRLHAHGAQTCGTEAMNQRDARDGLAHAGIGAGDEYATGGFGNRDRHASAVVRLSGGIMRMVNAASAAATLGA